MCKGEDLQIDNIPKVGEKWSRMYEWILVQWTAREEKRRKKQEEDNGTKWNVSAGVFYPAREKEETEKNKGRKEGEQMKQYSQSGLMVIHSDRLSDKEQRQKIKGQEEIRQE